MVGMTPMFQNYQELASVIEEHKTVHQVRLIAVTKFASLDQIREAYDAGIHDFGENKVQDALEKIEALQVELPHATWHFIGHLQSNKVNKVVGNFDWIHSVDSFDLAEKISSRAQALNIKQKILLQVNIAREEQKHGFTIENLIECFDELTRLPNCDVRGLMTIAPLSSLPGNMPPDMVFAGLRSLRDKISSDRSIDLLELSMGMSQDFKHALQSGATMLRVGSYLFQP